MRNAGFTAVTAALVVAALVGSTILLPAFGIDPLGLGARVHVAGMLVSDAYEEPADTQDPGPMVHSWPVASTVLTGTASAQGDSAAGSANDTSFATPAGPLSYVMVTLTWTEQPPPQNFRRVSNDSFQVTLKAPDGTTYTAPNSTTGTLVIHVPLMDATPFPSSVNATTRDEARQAVNRTLGEAASGPGTWTVTVTCERAGRYGLDGGPLGPVEAPAGQAPQDPGNAWTLTFEHGLWQATLGAPTMGDGGGMDHSMHTMG